jgi:hypothetical protein
MATRGAGPACRRNRTGARGLAPPILAAIMLAGCGYVGDPMPPYANIPAPISDLTVIQQGAHLIAHFTLPDKTTEGMPAKSPEPELRIGIGSGNEWLQNARAVPDETSKDGAVRYEIPSADWTGKNVTLGARTSIRPRKPSNWSNFVTVQVVDPPPAPMLAEPEATAKGIRVVWDGPSGDFRVFRRAPDDKSFTDVANVSQNNWTDPEAEYGTPYVYMVQRVVKLEGNREALSDPSAERTITAKDTFAPEPPAGFQASATPNSIELAWEGNSEPDLAGYRVYRAAPGGDFEKVAETPPIPHYSDATAERGKSYRYAVTAFDRAGNESARSAVSEAALQ